MTEKDTFMQITVQLMAMGVSALIVACLTFA